jgi:hypothetical protein
MMCAIFLGISIDPIFGVSAVDPPKVKAASEYASGGAPTIATRRKRVRKELYERRRNS